MKNDRDFLQETIELSKKCPPSSSAFSVGAIIVCADGKKFTGYSRETGEKNHAEEEALYKLKKQGGVLTGATLYSSLEPCSQRSSKPDSCSKLIIENKIERVVFADYEGTRFVSHCTGAQDMRNAGVEVVHISLTK